MSRNSHFLPCRRCQPVLTGGYHSPPRYIHAFCFWHGVLPVDNTVSTTRPLSSNFANYRHKSCEAVLTGVCVLCTLRPPRNIRTCVLFLAQRVQTLPLDLVHHFHSSTFDRILPTPTSARFQRPIEDFIIFYVGLSWQGCVGCRA